MKEIIAVIRSSQWQATKVALVKEGFWSYTVHRVHGRGRQKGLQYLTQGGTIEEGIQFLPKKLVTLFVNDEDLEAAVKVIVSVNQTGEIGDGKIFICPLGSAERIRTGEVAEEALA
jgi:nitrogen regulatory protein PII 2